MRVLVTWGSKRGGTEGIGRILGEALAERGFDVVASSAEKVSSAAGYDAVIVGGALYANRWPGNVRRFVNRHVRELRRVPVWFFSSGPLDDSPDHQDIPAPGQVAVLAERVGAKGHVTFGGRLERDAKGFPASAMAKTKSGDWRNPDRIRAWAADLATALPSARPATPVDHPAHSISRLLGYGLAGWALCAIVLFGLLALGSHTAALVLHAVAAPVVFSALAWRYFHARGAREPLPTALVWTAEVALLDLVIAFALQRTPAIFASIAATWLPFALVLLAAWGIGAMMSMMPSPKPPEQVKRVSHA